MFKYFKTNLGFGEFLRIPGSSSFSLSQVVDKFSQLLLLSCFIESDSVRPHRWQPTRLPHPWDSLGKNTGVGCHFFLQCMKEISKNEVTQSCPTLSDRMVCSPPDSSVHGILQARILEWVAISSSNA